MANLYPILENFAADVTAKLTLSGSGEPEDQLRGPFETFLRESGAVFSLSVLAKGEIFLKGIGRPDFSVHCNGALCGYVELKRPGKGANPDRYQGHDKEQWERFKTLPNILYTDGSEWALYQNGELVARRVVVSGDISADGKKAVQAADAHALEPLLREFLTWNPIVPSSAKELAKVLAPICRLLRREVEESMGEESSPFAHLAEEWRRTLFPGANDAQFADAYAQTVTFALLLARAEGGDTTDLRAAENALASEHALLAKTLKIFTDELTESEEPISLKLLQRIISQVSEAGWKSKEQDPWLYFYEDFLDEYDPKLRKDAGVYYTPVPVVGAMVRLTEDLLINRLGKNAGFASPEVMTLDPATGTGTFLLGVISHTLQAIAERMGPGAVGTYAEALAGQLHGFEMLVGPYAVSQLRLSRALSGYGASLPPGGPKIYLTDTLESPDITPEFPSLLSRELTAQHRKALEIKKSTPILVCLGNPPYDRHESSDAGNRKTTGGWVRWGDADKSLHDEDKAILVSFSAPVKVAGQGGHLKNLYNLYVYFWRWALWKVFEPGAQNTPGVVSFITASSFLEGPAFCGMREQMRRQCDDIWVIDLGGEGRGSRREENVFNIQTPVCITLAVRYGEKIEDRPAAVHYARIFGSREEKLNALNAINSFSAITWQTCPEDAQAYFKPNGKGAYFEHPKLTDLMPWQHSGIQFKRTWPIAPDVATLTSRWKALRACADREAAFRATTARSIEHFYDQGVSYADQLDFAPQTMRYGYRSFDRMTCFSDPLFCDRPRPDLQSCDGPRQIYFASTFVLQSLSIGPAVTLSVDVPDMGYFCNRGGKDIFPLYRDAAARQPNILPGLLALLSAVYGTPVSAEDFAAYAYGVLARRTLPSNLRKSWKVKSCACR